MFLDPEPNLKRDRMESNTVEGQTYGENESIITISGLSNRFSLVGLKRNVSHGIWPVRLRELTDLLKSLDFLNSLNSIVWEKVATAISQADGKKGHTSIRSGNPGDPEYSRQGEVELEKA